MASPLTQVLQTTQISTTNYLYGLDRLASVAGSTRTWYGSDALGSVRLTLSDSGVPLGVVNYDAWGTVESGTAPTFGFTGELQDAATGLVNLRARWYATEQGSFTSRDPFAGFPEQPYSQHPYQYAYSDPVNRFDPSGHLAIFVGGAGSENLSPSNTAGPGVWELAYRMKDREPVIGNIILASWSSVSQIQEKIAEAAESCPKEPIILIGHSLGGASIMSAAFWTPDVPIDLVVTIDPVAREADSTMLQEWKDWRPYMNPKFVYLYKASNVARQINLVEDFDAQEKGWWDRQLLQFLVEESIAGAENITIPNSSHISIDGDQQSWNIIESAIDSVLLKYRN